MGGVDASPEPPAGEEEEGPLEGPEPALRCWGGTMLEEVAVMPGGVAIEEEFEVKGGAALGAAVGGEGVEGVGADGAGEVLGDFGGGEGKGRVWSSHQLDCLRALARRKRRNWVAGGEVD